MIYTSSRLCGYPPFYSQHGKAALSPGMRERIQKGCYDFPEKEWSRISKTGKWAGYDIEHNAGRHTSNTTQFNEMQYNYASLFLQQKNL